MAAPLAAAMASEAFMPCLAAGLGVVAAGLFIAFGPTGPSEIMQEVNQMDAPPSAEEEAAAREAIKAGLARLTGESRGDVSSIAAPEKAPSKKRGGGGAEEAVPKGDAEAEVGLRRRKKGQATQEGPADAAAHPSAASTDDASGGDSTAVAGPAEAAPQEDALANKLNPLHKTKLTPEQHSQIRKSVSKMSPEHRKALHEWVNGEGDQKWALIAMNCLVFILFLAIVLGIAVYLIAFHEVNVFELDTWRNGAGKAKALLQEMRILPKDRPPQELPFHSPEL